MGSDSPSVRERPTARVLLFDPDGRILMMRGRANRAGPSVWFTVGGGIEPGETLAQAVAREVREEAGFESLDLGPVVWLRDCLLETEGGLTLLRERYVVAWCAGGEPSRAGWMALEQELCDDLRWWTLAEIAATEETLFPERFADLLPDILAGRYPEEPLVISVD